MSTVVGICIALLALALGLILLAEGREVTALFDTFRSMPLMFQVAWEVIAFVSLALVLSAVWLSYQLVFQRRAAQSLASRLLGVRDSVRGLIKTQVDTEAGVHQLARTDPEDAMAAIQARLTEAERFAQVQRTRNETVDLQSRVDYIRAQQRVLKDRLGPVLEKRRGIEQIFMELHAHQNDLERTLDELASADDAVALDISLKNMIEFVKRSHGRCDDIERALKIASGLKEEYAELRNRLVPLAAAESGIASRVEELGEARDRLTGEFDVLQQTPEGPLSQRVQQFLDDKKSLDRRLAEMTEDFAKLATLRRDVGALFAGFNRALHGLALSARGEGVLATDAGINELNEFVTATQAQLDDIERRLVTFRQLRTRLGEVQARLVPLESDQGGVISAIEELKDVRDRLATKISRMEQSEEGSLSERVHKFTESRRQLEERVLHLNEEFLKLTSIRKDISNLFERLSNAVSTSAK